LGTVGCSDVAIETKNYDDDDEDDYVQ